ncbi:MAG: nucleoside-diphosphate sugar epimerase/dehydratase [Pseudomonadota bacterium]
MTPKAQARRVMAMTLAYDAAAAGVAMWLAVDVRWRIEGFAPPFPVYTGPVAAFVFACVAAAAFVLMGVHRQVWRHAGWPDVVRIVQAAGLAVLFFLPVMFVSTRLMGFPRSSLLAAFVLWLAFLFAGRMVALLRSTRRPWQIFSPISRSAHPAVLVGDAQAMADALKALRRKEGGSPLRVLGLLQTGGVHTGRAIRGVTVMGGLDDLGQALDVLAVRYGETPWVAATGDGRDPANMSALLEQVAARGAKVMAIGFGDDGPRLKSVRPNDLLARPERVLDPAPVVELTQGASVFVTGGGGTIGSELSRQCAAADPRLLTIYDSSEYNLYEIDLALRAAHPDLQLRMHLGDVRNRKRLAVAMNEAQPDVVIHAAALKHVPLMEQNPCEAVLTNIGGALTAMSAAIEAGAKRFVLISTDKAVNPPNVMGATKRLAEIAIARLGRSAGLPTAIVRFGNVLGSSGSVVPLFERQIAAGGPVTVTHPDMTRYFMTVEEASRLVLQAAALHKDPAEAGLFVLDMGEPVRIEALAESMIRLKGCVPGRDILIEYSGPRPGERMHEELTYAHEALQSTGVEGVLRASGADGELQGDIFLAELDRLIDSAADGDRAASLARLETMVDKYSGGRGALQAVQLAG